MAPEKNGEWKSVFVDTVKKMPSVRSIVISSEDKQPDNRGWEETEEEYLKRQAEWLKKVGEKRGKK
ncbi:hypothetical protein [Desulfobotulus mexicanus]|uniref:Uncharacterized protein n=1 Tax=Desulfobotulus mexicanus TaxID=2586642 RepID=A0A5S5MFA5_9BACT|nr:hypothetical protein [Desulfobotulus mexicanus]TYT74357.1 hypothetical protein FIM25_10370 [Desulfobotulus mexicanus]